MSMRKSEEEELRREGFFIITLLWSVSSVGI
jgi:hypothetical protein